MFYGRIHELGIIRQAIESSRAELGIVYGRRRIGKSTLLKEAGNGFPGLYFEGLQGVSQKKQLDHFAAQLSKQTGTPQYKLIDWTGAFDALSYHITNKKSFVVFDEFPWMANGRTELISLLKYYWDNRWKINPALTLIVCGSVANFMLKHIVHSKALHNRKTFEIKLDPLSAGESKLFFKGLRSDFEIAKFLMIFGGVPKYLEQIDPVYSLADNLDKLCFQKNSFFVNEFDTIFKEQFKISKTYEKIISVLAKQSCSKEVLAKKINIASGGGLTSYLRNLEQADFIKIFSPAFFTGKGTKTNRIVLWDEWLKFYFTYMKYNINIIQLNTKPGLFNQLTSKSFDTYCGYAFERLCIKNFADLLDNLMIPLHQVLGYGPFFRQPARSRQQDDGLQIDILIHRQGHILYIVECKFSSRVTGLAVIPEIEKKIKLLKAPGHYTIEKILVCAGDISPELQQAGYFHRILGLDAVL